VLQEAARERGLGVGVAEAKARAGREFDGEAGLGALGKGGDLRAGPEAVAGDGANRSNGLANGDFENGGDGSWQELSSQGYAIILNEEYLLAPPHGGAWAAWLGGVDDEVSVVRQVVRIPATSSEAVLRFWIWIASRDECGYDFGGVVVNDNTIVDVFELCADRNTNGWVQRQVSLQAYAGRTVPLQIRAETDESENSNLFIDDVVLGSAPARNYVAFLPGTLRQRGGPPTYAPACSQSNGFCEPFNTWGGAYGALMPGRTYRAYPNDANDYYYVKLSRTASLTLQITNYRAIGQMLVRNSSLRELGQDWNTGSNPDGVMNLSIPDLQPGRYYIQLFTSEKKNQDHLYSLVVTH
jgi:hypothetical protein